MSDPMQMGKPPMPQGRPNPTRQAVEQNRSVMNPTDVSVMAGRGQMGGDMSVRDFFGQFGVDVDGPVSQLQKFASDQQSKADPLNKMASIANAGGGQRANPMPQGRKPAVESSGGLEGLMTNMGQ